MQWNKDTLRATRLKVGLSQTALAEALGVHFRTVQNWEKGITNIYDDMGDGLGLKLIAIPFNLAEPNTYQAQIENIIKLVKGN